MVAAPFSSRSLVSRLPPKKTTYAASSRSSLRILFYPRRRQGAMGGKQGEKAAMACAVAARFFHDERPDGLSSRLRATPSSKEKRQSSPSHLEGARERETCRQHVLEESRNTSVFSPQKPCSSHIALRLRRASGQRIDRGSTEMNRVLPTSRARFTRAMRSAKVIDGRKVCGDRRSFRLMRTASRMNLGSSWLLVI